MGRGRQKAQTAARGTRARPSRVVVVIGALLALEGIALGLKAFEDVQTRERHALESLQRESVALAERLTGQTREILSVVSLGQKTGASRSDLVETLNGIDAILTLRDAAQSPAGSRVKAAADAAVSATTRGDALALTSTGDVVFVVEQAGLPSLIALARAEDWMARPGTGGRFSLVGDVRIGVGNPALATATDRADPAMPDIHAGDGLERSASACAPVAASSLSACVSRPLPWLETTDLLRFLTYALLLAAPLLAIIGLMRMSARNRAVANTQAGRAESVQTQLDMIMTGARVGGWSWDPAGQTAELSQMAADLIGLEGAAPCRRNDLLACVAERDRSQVEAALDDASAKGWLQVSFATVASQGTAFVELRASPMTGEDDTADPAEAHLGGIAMDVTEYRRADLRLRRAERRLRNAIEGFSGPFALWDKQRRLLYWNRSFATTFGLEDTLRPGISQDTVLLARASAIRQERPSFEDGNSSLIELQDGRWLKLVERSTAEDGRITIALDITDNVRNESQLERQQKKLKSQVSELERAEGRATELARRYQEEKAKAEHAANTKSAFLANMSHELRTPLNAINGFSEILAEELYGPLGDPRYKGYAEDILSSGQHLLDLINDILDMAKIEAGKMTVDLQPIDPVDPVDAAIRMIRRKAEDKGIQLVLDAEDGLPDIDADHRAIRQMVLNLVSNALKFTDADGRVTVAVRQREAHIHISVTDTGIGIPRDQIARLGKPFEQISETRDRNFEGTGLGLALTKSFAEMHGGRLAIASEVGKGTRVSIYLPIRSSQAAREVA